MFATKFLGKFSGNEGVASTDLSSLSDEELSDTISILSQEFSEIKEQGESKGWTNDLLTSLQSSVDSLSAAKAAQDERAQAQAELAAKAADIASSVELVSDEAETEPETETEPEAETEPAPEVEAETETETEAETAPVEAVTASSPKKVLRIPATSVASHKRSSTAKASSDFGYASPGLPGYSQGDKVDLAGISKALSTRLNSGTVSSFTSAVNAGQAFSQSSGIVSIPVKTSLTITNDSPIETNGILDKAVDESRLDGGSLVASGGWCSPSETDYTLWDDNVSLEGLYDLPTVGVSRGGIRFTRGLKYSDIFANSGFVYTEAQDIDGNYGVDANRIGNDTAGDKPCYTVECPDDFVEERMNLAGVCIQSGLLSRRAYPELLEEAIKLALIAHSRRLSGQYLGKVMAGSTAITMPTVPVGATAPILSTVEMHVEHIRSQYRLSRNATMEAVFPTWTHAAIRADLARRLGVDLIDVSDERINAWFAQRGIRAQFVYEMNDIAPTAAGSFTAWPTNLEFLVYPAGTWVKGVGDVIDLQNIYDSSLLSGNDFTALFTEQSWLVAKRGNESRKVSLQLEPTGMTGGGVQIAADGTLVTV